MRCVFLLFLLSLLCVSSFFLTRITKEDVEVYHKLLVASEREESFFKVACCTSSHKRKKVEKRIFFTKEEKRHAMCLKSASSDLIMQQEGKSTRFQEDLSDVTILLQEELFYDQERPFQTVSFLVASRALYDYQNETLVAREATLKRFVAPGHLLPETVEGLELIGQGTSDLLSLNLSTDRLDLQKLDLSIPLGSITAEHGAFLEWQKGGFVELKEKVRLDLEGGGAIECGEANLDFLGRKGTFFSLLESERVVYQENVPIRGKQPLAVELQSRFLAIFLKSREEIESMEANGNVRISCGEVLHSESDQAFLQKQTGIVTLSSFGQGGSKCEVSVTGKGNIISDTIKLIAPETRVLCDASKGRLLFSEPDIAPLLFASDSLLWNWTERKVDLLGHVFLEQEGYGELETQGAVGVLLAGGENGVEQFHCQGKTMLSRSNESGLTYTLVCHGSVDLDHVHHTFCAEQQYQDPVVFTYPLGEVHAERIEITYEKRQGAFVPALILLSGNVAVGHNMMYTEGGGRSPLQCALADRVQLYPLTNRMILLAKPGNQVLYLDRLNHAELAAPEITISRDSRTKKERVESSGDVRLTFSRREMTALLERFKIGPGR